MRTRRSWPDVLAAADGGRADVDALAVGAPRHMNDVPDIAEFVVMSIDPGSIISLSHLTVIDICL